MQCWRELTCGIDQLQIFTALTFEEVKTTGEFKREEGYSGFFVMYTLPVFNPLLPIIDIALLFTALLLSQNKCSYRHWTTCKAFLCYQA